MSVKIKPVVWGFLAALSWSVSAAPSPADMNDAQGHTQHAEPLPLTLSQALTAKAFKKEVSEPHRYGVLESQEWHIRLP
ncbi:hypothetical protein [Chimaeribacter californicus]|uniref:hypothetical protein n=1 Tax=Chimaeribacter californicus TaxID=2060067 RepID=UPI0011AFC37B|nr:hypothetical protein [Chimaeribacter californicus]